MSDFNPYSPSALTPSTSTRVRFRGQQLLHQILLFSTFYFVGFGILIAALSGITAVPRVFTGVFEDFTGIWLPELIFALIPYIVLRALTLDRIARSAWGSVCVAGVVTFPFLHLYANALLTQWDTPMVYNLVAHLMSVASAIVTELVTLTCLGRLTTQNQHSE